MKFVVSSWMVCASCLCAAQSAGAQEVSPAPSEAPLPVGASAPVVLEVQSPTTGVAAEALQREVARELDASVVLSGAAQGAINVQSSPVAQTAGTRARGTLSIFVTPDGRLTVRWRDAQGREVQRSVAVPSDPFEFVRTVGVLAANLANDQVSDLVGPARAAEDRPIVVEVHVAPAAVVTPPIVARPPVAPPPAVVPAPDDWRALRARQRVSFGFDAYMSYAHGETAPDRTSVRVWSSVYGIGGLFVNWHATPWLRVGVQQVSGGGLTGGGFYLSAAPYAEALWAPIRLLEVYGQAGLAIEGQFSGSRAVALAPTATAGLRFRFGDGFSLGLGARVATTLKGTFIHSGTPIDAGSLAAGAGLELGWTFGR
jgi:hypothetical protein